MVTANNGESNFIDDDFIFNALLKDLHDSNGNIKMNNTTIP